MKRFLLNSTLIGLMFCGFIIAKRLHDANASLRSTSELRQYQGNLEILPDKDNNIPQLIEELQGLTVEVTTGTEATFTSSPSVIIPWISTGTAEGDTIKFVIVVASANNVAAASAPATSTYLDHDNVAMPTLVYRSKVGGAQGNSIRIVLTQNSTSTAAELTSAKTGTLQCVTTGYDIEVKLSSGDTLPYKSSGTMVINAVRNNRNANKLINIYATDYTTSVVTAVSRFSLSNGLGTPRGVHVLDEGYSFVHSTGQVKFTTGAPVTTNDMLIWGIYNRPKTQ